MGRSNMYSPDVRERAVPVGVCSSGRASFTVVGDLFEHTGRNGLGHPSKQPKRMKPPKSSSFPAKWPSH